MVCCNDVKVTNTASQCHYDNLIILINSNSGCGTASFYTKLCSKSARAGQVMAHELGHAFGNLADEYTYSDYFDYTIPEDLILEMPNCDVEGCPKWSSQTSECYEGCTSPNLYRSSQNSIMRYVSFGAFNEISKVALEKEIERRTQTETRMHQQNPQWRSYYVNLDYSGGEVKLSPVTIRPVKPGLLSAEGYFTANIKDENNNILYSSKLPLPLIEYPALEISEKPIINSHITLPVTLPFNPSAKTLEISHNNQVLATTSLAVFTDRCGDNHCQSSENNLNCANDCAPQNDNFCESTQCDPDCPNFEECNSNSQPNKKNYIWAILLIILPIILLIMITLKAKKN
jgi:hypothetical protein